MNKRKFNNRRKTKKTGGMADVAGWVYAAILCFVVGGILLGIGVAIGNVPLKAVGIAIILLPIMVAGMYIIGNS
jgi:hypothetical protein